MDRYLTERALLIENAAPGIDSARRLASLTDDALRRLVAAAPDRPPGRWALLALGGYGAGALLPGSDIDILVVFDGRPSQFKPFVEALLYPLWNAGLQVGHQVRSPSDHLRVARTDTTVLTATLSGRVLDGDGLLGQATLSNCARFARARSKRLLVDLVERQRPGSPYLLEPDLKNGAGGRRDYDELTWLSAILGGEPQSSPAGLVSFGILTAAELTLLQNAAETVTAARWELSASGSGSLMSLDAAQDMNTDAQAVQSALADTAHLLTRARTRAARGEVATDPLGSADFFALFEEGEDALPALEEAVWAGRLDHLLPGMRFVLPLRRPALAHTLTVGAHCLKSATTIAGLGRAKAADGPLGRSRALVTDLRALITAALTHDIGKAGNGPDHSQTGAPVARETALRLGLDEKAAQDVADLVELHLVLAETALHADLDSEDAVLLAASRIRRRELVAALHLLTAADSLATGPSAWGTWHEALVASLVARLDGALSETVDGAGIATRGEAVRAATLAAIGGADDESTTRAFVEAVPLRYLAARDMAHVLRDARTVATLSPRAQPHEARVAVRPGPIDDTFEVSIALADRPELFARIAGAFALSGLDILSADAYGTTVGVALDVFVVASATLAPVEPETWDRFERYLRAALADRLELEVRLTARSEHYHTRRAGSVDVRTDSSSGYDTAVLVDAPNRVGLLYDIARAISLEDLDIRWAKILTIDGMARDVFHVVGPDGQAPTDPGILGHLVMRIRERLESRSRERAPQR